MSTSNTRLLLVVIACFLVSYVTSFTHHARDAPVTASNISSQPPQLWVGQGTVNCGAPFSSEQCSFSTTLSQMIGFIDIQSAYGDTGIPTTITSTDLEWAPETTWYYTMTTTVVVYGELYFTDDCRCSGYGCSTIWAPDNFYTLLVPDYSPTISYSSYTPTSTVSTSSTVSVSATLARRSVISVPLETAIARPHKRARRSTLQKRDSVIQLSDWNACPGGIGEVGDNYRTNDVVQLCRFVGSYANMFVSLAPTAAAYMPTWLDYLLSLIVGVVPVTLFVQSKDPDDDFYKQPGMGKVIFGVVGFIIAIIRMISAIVRLATYSADNFKTLPFISPLLWVDWLVVFEFSAPLSRVVEPFAGFICFILYIICFWLCIGYGSLGYGTEQYHILFIPEECQYIDIQWQTDPRRVHFLRFHIIIFAFASFVVVFVYLLDLRRRNAKSNEPDPGRRFMKAGIPVLLILPYVAAILCAAILNPYSYIVLNRGNCWGSYVSGRVGYVDVEFQDWKRRLATWFGVNV